MPVTVISKSEINAIAFAQTLGASPRNKEFKHMIKIRNIILLMLWTNLIFGQEIDSLGLDNNSLLNKYESAFIKNQFEKENIFFDFTKKRIAFYQSLTGFKTKQEYFNDCREWLENGQDGALQLVILNETEQKESGGFDAIIVAWSKKLVSPKMKSYLIDELKRAST
jgi:hypothetical protein